jgi:predicted transposase YdaD
MRHQDAKETAQMMLRLHGLRAQAIAQERAAEMRQQGDAKGLDHWQQIHMAICEMRQVARQQHYGESHADLRS